MAEKKVFADIKISGKIVQITKVHQVTDTFKKRELWVQTPGDYPQTINIEFHNAKSDLLNELSIGDNVEVSVNINGRVNKDRCYNTIVGWKVNVTDKSYLDQEPPIINPLDDSEPDLPF